MKPPALAVGYITIDRVFSVGDLVDRGENSVQCAALPLAPWFHAVQGNHENMSIRYPLGNMDTDNYRRNGGAWMIDINFSRLDGMYSFCTLLGTQDVIHLGASTDVFVWYKKPQL